MKKNYKLFYFLFQKKFLFLFSSNKIKKNLNITVNVRIYFVVSSDKFGPLIFIIIIGASIF